MDAMRATKSFVRLCHRRNSPQGVAMRRMATPFDRVRLDEKCAVVVRSERDRNNPQSGARRGIFLAPLLYSREGGGEILKSLLPHSTLLYSEGRMRSLTFQQKRRLLPHSMIIPYNTPAPTNSTSRASNIPQTGISAENPSPPRRASDEIGEIPAAEHPVISRPCVGDRRNGVPQ